MGSLRVDWVGRGLIPLSSEHLHSLHRILLKFVSGKVVTLRKEWTGFCLGSSRCGASPREPQKFRGCGFLGLGTVSCLRRKPVRVI